MVGVTMEETGLRYVWETMKVYWGEGLPFLLFFALGLFWVLADKKQKDARLFWQYTIILGLTVYNPFLVRLAVPRLVEEAVYYRFLWALPAALGAAYFMTELTWRFPGRFPKVLAAAALAVLAVTATSVNDTVLERLSLPSNIYKVPDELVEACALIHEDYEGEEAPKAVFAFELELFARQYDASIRLTIDRDTRLYYNGSQTVGNPEGEKTYKWKKRILDAINSVGNVKLKQFKRAMKSTRTSYLVLSEEDSCHDYLKEAGCEEFARAGKYILYRYRFE